MIEVRDLSKRFGSTLAVDHLSFSVRPGMVTGFLGPNGSGKSTTMRMILGLDRPSKGRTAVNGRPYGEIRRPLHEVGALLDAKAMHGGRSAYNHLLCVAQSNGIPQRRVGECLDLVGLDTVGRRRARTYSLGMGQRLGIATALLLWRLATLHLTLLAGVGCALMLRARRQHQRAAVAGVTEVAATTGGSTMIAGALRARR